jgi:hypothetical protein
MDILLTVGVIAVVVAIFTVMAENRKKAQRLEQSKGAEIESVKQQLLTAPNHPSLPVLNTSDYGYRPVAKETRCSV